MAQPKTDIWQFEASLSRSLMQWASFNIGAGSSMTARKDHFGVDWERSARVGDWLTRRWPGLDCTGAGKNLPRRMPTHPRARTKNGRLSLVSYGLTQGWISCM